MTWVYAARTSPLPEDMTYRMIWVRKSPTNHSAELCPFFVATSGAINLPRRAVNEQKENTLARRRFQRGHLFLQRTKSGSFWVARFKEDVIRNNRVHRVKRAEVLGDLQQLPTRRLAQRALEDRLRPLNSRRYRPTPVGTFAEVSTRWENTVLCQLRPSTAANYRTHLHKHLVPFFGKYPMKDIGLELTQQFVSQVNASAKTVRNLYTTLRSFWRFASDSGYVERGSIDRVYIAQSSDTDRFFFSTEQVRRILEAASEPERTFYGLLAETGLRVGELCGLRIDDLDFERRLLVVRRSAWRGKLGAPKTKKSTRAVELSPQAIDQLKLHLHSWRPNPDRLVFASRNGTPWDANLLLKRKFRPLLEKLKIQVPSGNGFHALRHTSSTLMDQFSAPLRVRQQRLGHTDSRLTLGVYTHVASEDANRVAGQLGEAVWGSISASKRPQDKKEGLEPEAQTPQ
jgi:integrase